MLLEKELLPRESMVFNLEILPRQFAHAAAFPLVFVAHIWRRDANIQVEWEPCHHIREEPARYTVGFWLQTEAIRDDFQAHEQQRRNRVPAVIRRTFDITFACMVTSDNTRTILFHLVRKRADRSRGANCRSGDHRRKCTTHVRLRKCKYHKARDCMRLFVVGTAVEEQAVTVFPICTALHSTGEATTQRAQITFSEKCRGVFP
ncbi:hypothetical protein FI667_g2092, partial [Globisporangium splendens]